MGSQAVEKRLFALSGNECAFPGCREPVSTHPDGRSPVTLGEIAHIVAKSRQGPRGRSDPRGDGRIENLILLCEKHHKLVDADPQVFSVGVLRKMKADHEARVADLADVAPLVMENVTETLHLTALPLVHAPLAVYTAETRARKPREVGSQLRHGAGLTPFALADGRLWAFHDLKAKSGPFREAVDRGTVEQHGAEEMWDDPDLARLYVQLLNKSLTGFLHRRGLVYDGTHRRHYFRSRDGEPVEVTTSTKTGRQATRRVVFEQTRRSTGEGIGVWWHWAARFRFEHLGQRRWVLTVRPEFHLTKDGTEPLEPRRIGRRVTRKKASIFNDRYFDLIHFWRALLADDTPRAIINVGGQSIIVGTELPTCEIQWSGVPDRRFDLADVPDDDLFTLAEYESALEGLLVGADGEIDDEEELS